MTHRRVYSSDELRALLLVPDGPLRRLEVVASVPSTNTAVAADLRADPGSWPSPGLLVADEQTAGRGRAGRTWVTPPGEALTCTFVMRPTVGRDAYGWFPLLAGLGLVRALRATAGVPAALKWPNDVLLDAGPNAPAVPGWGTARKVAGILVEVVPDAPAEAPVVLVGIGVNVSQRADELPVPFATSLAAAGARHVDREGVLVALVTALSQVADRFAAAGGDAAASGLAEEVASVCLTLGERVVVELPGGRAVTGTAVRLDRSGALVVRQDDGAEVTVLAGDVTHVRASGPEER